MLEGLIPSCEDGTSVSAMHLGRLFSFSIMWSLGALLELEDRAKLEAFLRRGGHVDLPNIPPGSHDTVFEFVVNNEGLTISRYVYDVNITCVSFTFVGVGEWDHWKTLVQEYVYPKDVTPPFWSILVPNVDNVRTDFLVRTVAKQHKVGDSAGYLFVNISHSLFQFSKGVMLIGEQGSAKTVILNSYCAKYNPEEHMTKSLNFSSATTPNLFQVRAGL